MIKLRKLLRIVFIKKSFQLLSTYRPILSMCKDSVLVAALWAFMQNHQYRPSVKHS